MKNNEENSKAHSRAGRASRCWAVLYGIALTGYALFTLLDAFVIPQDIVYVEEMEGQAKEDSGSVREAEGSQADAMAQAEPVVTDNSYLNDSISLTITTARQYETDIYIADIVLKDASLLKAGLAGGVFGRNVDAPTSEIARENDAIFAVNGDYYGFRSSGYVMRNGYLYRDSARSSTDDEALVIYENGNMETVRESEVSAETLQEEGAVQIFSFGPDLLQDGEITVGTDSEVEQAMRSNPRTAIGMIEPLHYVIIVSDGRTSASAGLTLQELAQVFQEQGCQVAYNLDGGGSSTMWFMGEVINNPTNGTHSGERSVSDIVYISE